MTSCDPYVRPGALLTLATHGLGRCGLFLVPQERGELSEAGTQDDTVILTSMGVDSVPLVRWRMRGMNPDQPLFSIKMKKYRTHSTQAAATPWPRISLTARSFSGHPPEAPRDGRGAAAVPMADLRLHKEVRQERSIPTGHADHPRRAPGLLSTGRATVGAAETTCGRAALWS